MSTQTATGKPPSKAQPPAPDLAARLLAAQQLVAARLAESAAAVERQTTAASRYRKTAADEDYTAVEDADTAARKASLLLAAARDAEAVAQAAVDAADRARWAREADVLAAEITSEAIEAKLEEILAPVVLAFSTTIPAAMARAEAFLGQVDERRQMVDRLRQGAGLPAGPAASHFIGRVLAALGARCRAAAEGVLRPQMRPGRQVGNGYVAATYDTVAAELLARWLEKGLPYQSHTEGWK